jgi:hypothetical protein
VTDKRTAIFVGPSATGIRRGGDYALFPPASAGDFDSAVKTGFDRIVYADALFFDAAPTHREVLRALDAGVEVFGVSSAGALRAVELAGRGMVGFGIVYNLYQRNILADDGELACSLSDQCYIAISLPLIQVRYYFGYLREFIARSDALRKQFSLISDRYFMLRDASFIRAILHQAFGDEFSALLDITDPIFDIKTNDLANLLQALNLKQDQPGYVAHDINKTWLRRGLRL